jgi:hypothetical protein
MTFKRGYDKKTPTIFAKQIVGAVKGLFDCIIDWLFYFYFFND